jgi:Ala-tRNA(Pro) deacylase
MNDASSKLLAYLDERDVRYRTIEHPAAASAEEYHDTLGTRYEQQAKGLLVRYKKPGEKGFVVLALQAQKQADFAKVVQLLEAREAKLATLDQLTQTTGCRFGELSPFASLFGLRLLFDRDLLGEDEIYFNAGSLTFSIAIAPDQLVQVEQPVLY